MIEFEFFYKMLGKNYYKNLEKTCYYCTYNELKIFNKKFKNHNQYIQGANEAIYYYWLRSLFNNVTFNWEINFSTNVDIFCHSSDIPLCIEVKSPSIDDLFEEIDKKEMFVSLDHRYDNLPSNESPILNQVDKIVDEFNKNSEKTNKVFKKKNLKDLKLKTYLESANKKMNKYQDSANILLICCDTSTFVQNIDYILNVYTGIFTRNAYINLKDYPNVDFIIFSNCSEAHLDPNFKFNVWDAKNYINFVIPTSFEKTEKAINKRNYVAEIFNDEFMKFFEDKEEKYSKDTFNILLLKLLNFIEIEHPCFAVNKTRRKYKF